MYKLNSGYLMFDAYDLSKPKLFLSDVKSHDTLIMEGDTREAFLEILENKESSKEFYEVFREYEIIDEV